jgi:hypothetical protein
MSEPIKEETNIVPLFKTFDELDRDEHAIALAFYNEWQAAYRRWDLVKVVLADDNVTLTKLDVGDIELAMAKSAAGKFRSRRDPTIGADAELAAALRAACEKRDARMFGFGALAKRSQRFASAQLNRSYGPGATAS